LELIGLFLGFVFVLALFLGLIKILFGLAEFIWNNVWTVILFFIFFIMILISGVY